MLVKIQENFYDENKKLILDKSYWAGRDGHYATYEKLHACLRIIRNPQLLIRKIIQELWMSTQEFTVSAVLFVGILLDVTQWITLM